MSTSSSLDNVIVRFKECEVERRASYYRYRQVQLVRLQSEYFQRTLVTTSAGPYSGLS